MDENITSKLERARAMFTGRPQPSISDIVARNIAAEDGISDLSETFIVERARRVVIHESGHAVAGSVLFGRGAVMRIAISADPDEEMRGSCTIWVPAMRLNRGDRRDLEKAGLYAYAGIAAELCSPISQLPFSRDSIESLGAAKVGAMAESADQDREALEHMTWGPHIVRSTRWRHDYFLGAFDLLANRWPQVETVAALLGATGRVTGEAVDLIVHGHPSEPSAPTPTAEEIIRAVMGAS